MTSDAPPVFSDYDLWCGLHAAWRRGHLRHALFFAETLRLRLTTQPGARLRDWETRIPTIVEVEKIARKQLEEIAEEAKGATDGIRP